MKQYYLAHQLKYRHGIRSIELELEKKYGINLINPFYDTERNDIKRIDSGEIVNLDLTVKDKKDIVAFDLDTIKNCDGVICFIIDHDVIGSFMEIFYAWRELNIPVYIVCPNDKIRLHPWVVTCSFKLFKYLEELEDYIKENMENMK